MTEQWREMALSPDIDLDMLVLVLNREGIVYRIDRADSGTRLWVAAPADMDAVHYIVEQIQRVASHDRRVQASQPATELVVRAYLTRLPVTIVALVLGILGAVLVSLAPDLVAMFTFQSFTVNAVNGNPSLTFEPLSETLRRGEWWRLASPAFLHFGLFHIVFNSLWLWEFGRRIELLVGSWTYLVLFSALVLGANAGQYLWSGPALFGGLSGVVYGLLGYIWIRGRRIPHPLLTLPGAILPIMLVWLAVCLLGVVDIFIGGGVANGAHVSGLVIGMTFGAIAGGTPSERV